MNFAWSVLARALALGGVLGSPAAALAAKTLPAAPAPSPIAPPSGPDLRTDAASDPVKPTACSSYQPSPSSKAIGYWSLRQRDDGEGWAGPWTVEFKADGSWEQNGEPQGYWCQSGDLFFFGFADDPHTTYRGTLNIDAISGVEAWNGGGTGIFEAVKTEAPPKKAKKKKKKK